MVRVRHAAAAAGIALILGMLLGFFGPRIYDEKIRPLPSGDGTVSRVTVTPDAPLQALDKKELRKRREIPKAVEKDPDAAVLATGMIEDDSGRRSVAVILDLPTGASQIVESRPFMEFMGRWEAGAGFGLVDGCTATGAKAGVTFGRIWEMYGSAQVEVFEVDRLENRHPWTAMVWGTVRF